MPITKPPPSLAPLAAALAMAACWSATAPPALAQPQNCPGCVPLTDLGPGLYLGFQGGLYPGGLNTPPAPHLAAAVDRARQIVPRDAAGAPDPDGLIVFLSFGMSNTTHEFGAFERLEDASPRRNARVVIINTAMAGVAANQMAPPGASYWSRVDERLSAMGVTPAQVQAAWLKQAHRDNEYEFPERAARLRDDLARIANNLHDRFPNLNLCWVSSRIYTYADFGEPQSYENGFAAKWLIESQIDGDPALNFDPARGPVESPLLLWGPYLWANGPIPRADGLVWLPEDFEDAVHPSPSGERKVADLLSGFFASDPSSTPWWWPKPGIRLRVVDAAADAHVSAAEPGANYGADPRLLVSGGASPLRAHVKFDLGAAPLPARLAKLSVRVAEKGGGEVSLVADTGWDEDELTFANAPPIGGVLATHPRSTKDGTWGADATDAVNADPDGILGFALTSAEASPLSYRSAEDGHPPRLVLVVPDPCPADLTDDGALSVQDFLAFLALYADADPRADFDPDGAITIGDLLGFLGAFSGGCPS